MVATSKPINDPEIVPRTTFTGMNHLTVKKIPFMNHIRKDEEETQERKPLKHLLESNSLSELGEDQAGKQKREDQLGT